ncbi:hydroxysqualene dehydroxylase HpnE [Paludibacterium yongneupense]|uniref:hydroxysqualene dehydroxylase HpnE n=1 Tax=Paludibacterium yongneupense TaxID=400061 RepID=UPI000409E8C3|nr:hydroxysqualene dehydroxylase HpnE [Paludibacterium yongneupense]
MSRPRIAVIGAGWAGLAASIELAPVGEVVVFEAGREAGGRARRVRDDSESLDNGQHILIGAYRECLRLMRCVGSDPERSLQRLPLSWYQADGLRMACPSLPAPWHLVLGLLRADGLSWGEKYHLARALGTLRRSGWQVAEDGTVSGWLRRERQPEALLERFWRPLVLSALNTPLEIASMRILATVLRDSLGGSRADSDLLLPRGDLSALFPDPACAWLREHGAELRFGHRVDSLETVEGGVRVEGERFDAAIVAVAPYHALALIGEEAMPAGVKDLSFWPIYTVYLRFARPVRLPRAMTGLAHGTVHWMFSRADGLFAAVISAPDAATLPSRTALVAAVVADARRVDPGLPEPLWSRVVVEKRATFAAVPGRIRPPARTGLPQVYLAGDWVDSPYPATLEGAVRSGVGAADALRQDWDS